MPQLLLHHYQEENKQQTREGAKTVKIVSVLIFHLLPLNSGATLISSYSSAQT